MDGDEITGIEVVISRENEVEVLDSDPVLTNEEGSVDETNLAIEVQSYTLDELEQSDNEEEVNTDEELNTEGELDDEGELNKENICAPKSEKGLFVADSGQPTEKEPIFSSVSANSAIPETANSATDQEIDDEEEIGVAETYSTYEPAKLKLGRSHPDQVVESSSLASVEPTDIWYSLSLPENTVNSCALSALQLEAIIYAAQQHEIFLPEGFRAGFFIGDGTGVGKGRTVAGIIFENYLNNRKKAIWISISNDLKYDCERDLKDVGASRIRVHSLNKMEYTKIDSFHNGSIKEGVIYSTYSSLIGRTSSYTATFKTRLEQLIDWCGADFDGPIIFDESHRAKNLCPGQNKKSTKTGLAVLQLQLRLPKARIVYVSATGASVLRNMAYMTRLGLWGQGTPFADFPEFLTNIEKRGVGAMEIIAIDMKLRGMYIARQLSFQGVTFRIEEVPLDENFVQMYNDSVQLWVEIKDKLSEILDMPEEDDEDDEYAEEEDLSKFGANKKNNKENVCRRVWSQFWVAHQRFFKYLCIAAKVKHTVELTKAAIKDGKCVVIGLLSTGEAQTLDRLEREGGELSDFISTAKGVLQNFVEKHYPSAKQTSANNSKQSKSSWSSMDGESDLSDSGSSDSSEMDSDEMMWQGYTNVKKRAGGKNTKKGPKKRAKFDGPVSGKRSKDGEQWLDPDKVELLEKIEALGKRLPTNTLDQLVDQLGGPENVAEMTGRKGRIVQLDGSVEYESRAGIDSSLETLNLIEKQKFMDGERNIVIISEAASSGISLHSDKRAKNQRRRVHITLEMPWSADKAMQQFGRTHRSNQVNAPEYIFLISDLAGERRFASTVARHLESLGALTHGDRRATETRDLSRFNVYNKYGRSALAMTITGVAGLGPAYLPAPEDYRGNFFADVTKALTSVGMLKKLRGGNLKLDNDAGKLTKFLNRLLGLEVELQNRLFKYFHDVLHAIVTKAKKEGKYDLGILDLGAAGEDIKRVKTYTFQRKHLAGVATTQLHVFHVERGMSWEEAFAKYSELTGPCEGFYASRSWRNMRRSVALAIFSPLNGHAGASSSNGTNSRDTYVTYRPNLGLQTRKETLTDLRVKFEKVETSVAEKIWTDHYKISENSCAHAYWSGFCKIKVAGLRCENGLRKRTYVILSGSIMNLWTKVEAVLKRRCGDKAKLQIVRLKTSDGYKTIGTIIPNGLLEVLRAALASDSEKATEETFVENCNIYMPPCDEIFPSEERMPQRQKKVQKKSFSYRRRPQRGRRRWRW